MATPTATAKPTPGQAHAPFTPGVSSPAQHPNVSNKTVRSPVSHMKRSRADTLRGTEQGVGTPRAGQPGSSPGFLGTPSQNQGGSGLGISMSTPNGGMGTPGGAAMQRGTSTFGLSSLGIDASLLNADREAYTKQRLAAIRDFLTERWGQVSRVGIQRLAARLRLECLWETGENEEKGILDLAGDGNGIFLQITFKGETVEDVHLSFPTPEGSSKAKDPEDEERGSRVLKRDLQGWDKEQDQGYFVGLGKFGDNMQHLAEIDHLGKGGISCFEAIDGVYKSLKTVEDWWKQWSKKGELATLNQGVGWPRLHANGKVGSRLDYWMYRWQVYKDGEVHRDAVRRDPDMFGLRLGVMPLVPGAYHSPICISSDWFSFLDDMPVDDSIRQDFVFPPVQLQRKDPNPTYLPSSEVSQADEGPNPVPGVLPSIMFRTLLDPPLPISYMAAQALLTQPNDLARPYASLLFAHTNFDPQNLGSSIPFQGKFYHKPSKSQRTLYFRLSNANALPAFMLHEVPFSHPYEIMNMLPTLRLWAMLQKLISSTMGDILVPASQGGTSTAKSPKKKKKKMPTAREARAIIKAGGTFGPVCLSSDDSDSEGRHKSQSAKLDAVDVSLELPMPTHDGSDLQQGSAVAAAAVGGGVTMHINIPIERGIDPVMAQFSLLPGPRIEAAGSSANDAFAQEMAAKLQRLPNIGVLVLQVRELKAEEARKNEAEERGGGEDEEKIDWEDETMVEA